MTKKEAIQTYCCPGCTVGSSPDEACFKPGPNGCESHCPGTHVFPANYTCVLGLPKGFNRVGSMGQENKTQVWIFKSFNELQKVWKGYDKFNIPVWAHVDNYGNTLVRVFQPRLGTSYIHIILEDCLTGPGEGLCPQGPGSISPVHVITSKDIKEMD